jgi:hypothetical protein
VVQSAQNLNLSPQVSELRVTALDHLDDNWFSTTLVIAHGYRAGRAMKVSVQDAIAMVVNHGLRRGWRQKHNRLDGSRVELSESSLKFRLLLFLVQVCEDKQVCKVAEPNAGAVLERGLVLFFLLFLCHVALERLAVNANLIGL